MVSINSVVKFFSYGIRDVKTGKFLSRAQAGQKVKDAVSIALKQKPVVSAATIEQGLGIGNAAKSARESMGVFIKRDIEQALKQKPISAASINESLGIGKAAKSAKESMGAFIKADIEQISKKAKFNPAEINTSLGIGKTVKSAEESAKVFLEQGVKKSSSIWKKVGKWGLIGLGIAGLIGGGMYLYKKYKDSKSQTPVTPTPVKPNPKPVKPNPTPVKPDPKPSETYTVKKGDNLWNIAKQYLKDQHKNDSDYKPSDKDILAKTEELMKLNNKQYEQPLPSDSRKRVVIIKPNEQIKLN